MKKTTLALFGGCVAFSALLSWEWHSNTQLRRQLNTAVTENTRLRQEMVQRQERAATPDIAESVPSAPNPTRVQELESEVLRLRGASGRAALAEAELAELRSHAG